MADGRESQTGVDNMTDPLRWGILGTGSIAGKFAAELHHTPRAVVAACGSRSETTACRFAGEHGGTAHAGYQALLDDAGVDAVYVSLPNAMHCEWTIRAIESGKHVLCEKPMASTAAEAERMFDAALSNGKLLVEAFMYRCHPAIDEVIRLVHRGEIGQLKLIRSHFTFNRPVSPHDARYDVRMAGGSLMDVGCYCVNFSRALAGCEPDAVQAAGHLHTSGVDDYAAGVLEFPGDVLASFTCGMTVDSDRTTYICGSKGYIAIDSPWFCSGEFTIGTLDERRTIAVESGMPAYALEADRFAAAVDDGAEPFVAEADTLGNMRVLDELRSLIGVPY